MSPKVTAVKCPEYELDIVYKAIKNGLKNISFQMPKNKTVLLKPNVLGAYKPEAAVTTHPIFVEAMCKMLTENNCKIIVGESSGFSGSTKNAMYATGIMDAAEKYGAEVIAFESTKIMHKKIRGRVLDKVALPALVDEVDIIINMPKLKTHSLMTYTAGVKNLFGLIPGGRKPDYHRMAQDADHFAGILCDIYQTVKPKVKLTILDAVVGMEGNGPSAGRPKKTGLVLVADDAGAMDYAVQKIIGLESPLMKCLIERKLLDTDKIILIGEMPSIHYRPPTSFISLSNMPNKLRNFIEKHMTAHPHVTEDKCVKCGICMKACPVKAIKLKPYPDFDRDVCIDCYCCHELCPQHAIYLKGTWLRNLLMRIVSVKAKLQRR